MPGKTDRKALQARIKELEAQLLALRQSQAMPPLDQQELDAVFENNPLMMLLVDHDLRVCRMNQAAVAMIGQEAAAVIGRRSGEAMHCINALKNPEGCGFSEACKACVIRNTVLDTFRTGRNHRAVEGSILYGAEDEPVGLWVNVYTRLLRLPQGERVLVCLEDITDRKRAEMQLQESEARFYQIFSYMSSGVAIYEAVDGGRDFVFKQINPAGARIGKLSPEAHIGKRIAEVYPGVKQMGFIDVLRRVWQSGGAETFPLSQYQDARISLWVENFIFKLPSGEIVAVFDDITQRKAAQEELRSVNQTFDLLFSCSQAAIVSLDRKANVTMWNPAAERMFGWQKADVIGKPYPAVPADGQRQFRELFENQMQGQSYNIELLRRKKNGSLIWVSASTAPLQEKDGSIVGLISIMVDVTQCRKAQEELQENERYFRSLLHSLHEDILVIDADYHITDVNDRMLITSGLTRDEVIGRKCFEVSHGRNAPCDAYGEDCQLKKVFKDGTPRTCRHRHQHADGSRSWVEIVLSPLRHSDSRHVTHVVEAVRDVTDMIRIQEGLVESEKQYRTLVENAHEAIFIIQDGLVRFPNPKTEELTGYAAEELARMPFDELVHPDDRRMVFERHRKRLAGEKVPDSYAFRVIDRKGDIIWVQVSAVVITWHQKPATLNFVRDISQERKLEERLRQAQKMEAIGTLAGGIAHDFNNILFPVLGYAELALTELPADSPLRGHLKGILSGAMRAKELVKQILTFSRQTEQEFKPLKMQLIVKEALKLVRSTLPSTIEISQKIDSGCPPVMADPTHIHQIVMNLATNAYHAMEDSGGRLEVILKSVYLTADDLKDPDASPGAYVCLTVGDTGTGMDDRTLKRIFEPYFTTKETGRGTGLGLAVVHGIVKRCKGTIRVYSEPGKGTVLHVCLPQARPMPDLPERENGTSVERGSERILLVDDEAPIVEMEKQILERLGYRVTTRTSSLEALEVFRAKPASFDLVITDMTMPNMTGDKLAEELMEIRSDIAVILCTGFSERISEKQAKAQGIKAFLMKPVSARDLAHTVRDILDA